MNRSISRARLRVLTLIMTLSVAGLQGCGDDDDEYTFVPPTPIPHAGPPHSIMRVGSTLPSGGKLTVNQVPTAFVVAAACLGGAGDACTGGIVVYNETSPGFNDLTADDATVPIYRLPDGIEIRIELTAIDTNASLTISNVQLDTVGETAVVNTTGHLHNHPVWQFVAPAEVASPPDKTLSFRLHANGFQSSDELTVTLTLFDEHGDGGGDHD